MAKEESRKELVQNHVDRLFKAYYDRSDVVITYVSESEPGPSDFILSPSRIFKRNDCAYVEGWSARKPKRIKLYLELERSAKVRVFQVDRIVNITERKSFCSSLVGYVVNRFLRRGVTTGVWGLLLDLLVLLFFVSIAYQWILN
jgi:predicted DNA-binding transcriptional regulator YafY